MTSIEVPDYFWWVLTLLVIWDLTWKGMALWKAARQSDKAWFLALMVLNTVGILPILYIFVFSKRTYPATPIDAQK